MKISIICAACHLPIEGADLDTRHWGHEPDCPNGHLLDDCDCDDDCDDEEEGIDCDCDLEYHSECCPDCKAAFPYRILDSNLHDQDVSFQTADDAVSHIKTTLHYGPYYIEDAGGNLVELVLNGVRWVPKSKGE